MLPLRAMLDRLLFMHEWIFDDQAAGELRHPEGSREIIPPAA